MRWTRSDTEMLKPVAGATIGSIVAAVAAMLTPVAPIEHLTSATGLSEIIPSMAPPLGPTAQSLLALGLGAAVFFILLLFLMERPKRASAFSIDSRPQNQPTEKPVANIYAGKEVQSSAPWLDTGSTDLQQHEAPIARLISTIGARLSAIAREGLSRRASSEDLGDFSDLKRKSAGDSHRSILNARDLGEPLPPLVDPAPAPRLADEQDRPGLSDALELLHGAGCGHDGDMRATDPGMNDAPDHVDLRAETPAIDSGPFKLEMAGLAAASRQDDSSLPDSGEVLNVPAIDLSRSAATVGDRTIDNLMARLERGLQQRRATPIAEPGHSIPSGDPVMREAPMTEPRIGRGREDTGDEARTAPVISSAPFRSISSARPEPRTGSDEPMDEGLRNALKTLRRMTAQGN